MQYHTSLCKLNFISQNLKSFHCKSTPFALHGFSLASFVNILVFLVSNMDALSRFKYHMLYMIAGNETTLCRRLSSVLAVSCHFERVRLGSFSIYDLTPVNFVAACICVRRHCCCVFHFLLFSNVSFINNTIKDFIKLRIILKVPQEIFT